MKSMKIGRSQITWPAFFLLPVWCRTFFLNDVQIFWLKYTNVGGGVVPNIEFL